MLLKANLGLVVCIAITGCAQFPKNDADGGSWWTLVYYDKGAAKDSVTTTDPATVPLKPSSAAPVAKAQSVNPMYWPFDSSDSTAKADAYIGSHWWPFGSKDQKAAKTVTMSDPKVTQAWLDDYERRLRTAIKDSNLQLERRENVLVVIAPVEGSFNPRRPAMLLPVTLSPFTNVAKILEADPKTAVLVLGHSDNNGAAPANVQLSQERAQSVAAIFRLSGLQSDRLILRGMGSDAPRATNDSTEGRALNRRIELLVTPKNAMLGLLSKYKMAAPAPATLVASQDIKPAVKLVVLAPATKKAAVSSTKKAAIPARKAPVKASVKRAAKAKAATTDKKK